MTEQPALMVNYPGDRLSGDNSFGGAFFISGGLPAAYNFKTDPPILCPITGEATSYLRGRAHTPCRDEEEQYIEREGDRRADLADQ